MIGWKRIAALLALAVVVLLVSFWPSKTVAPVAGERPDAPSEKTPENEPAAPPFADAVQPPAITPQPRSEESRAASRRDLENPLAPASIPEVGNAPVSNTDAATEADIDRISLMFRDYRTITGENPVGTHAEIMQSIMGGNPKGAMLGPPEGLQLNENSELIDRWGTPYFFHQLTRDVMEIHSAGPDRILWTGDDVIGK